MSKKSSYGDALQSKPSANPYARVPMSEEDFAKKGQLTDKFVRKILTSYLTKSPRARDKKAITAIVSEFVTAANELPLGQLIFLKRMLLSMAPQGNPSLVSAHTTPDSIKARLKQLLEEARRQQ